MGDMFICSLCHKPDDGTAAREQDFVLCQTCLDDNETHELQIFFLAPFFSIFPEADWWD